MFPLFRGVQRPIFGGGLGVGVSLVDRYMFFSFAHVRV